MLNTSEDEKQRLTGTVLEGIKSGTTMQTRFKLIPDAHLNPETIAGIRDMNLGRIRTDGIRVGAPTIRFDTGQNSVPHININPKGKPSVSDPHFQVPEGVIEGAKVINKTLKYVGTSLTVAAVVVDSYRIGCAFKDDLYIRANANEIILELEESIEKLKKALETETDSSKRQEIRYAIEQIEENLKDVKRTRKVPVKTLKTVSSTAGGWSIGAAGGASGAWIGTKTGTMIGTICGGPVGAAIGAPFGAIVGAIGGGIMGGILGSKGGEVLAKEGLEFMKIN
ncbi:hypothetical protein HZU73_00539 [Apis mellifera caucasica]|uniref:Uncharacterized protein LOC100577161 n=1 Tax=Apis mellifera TaxID=7460 RepID=A0A7M7GAW1_APIME|nr:uncharacterized protein LOC100577161 [Apis mellifera]KAG6804139.1 hypothetical protein HZU73_00539 [Apis mellifera caucasica]KAG9435526.1 hypothetical protein HZU67_01949 [Apis mellifera carnica]|eukprot:XP_003251870.2 uncharacterized protein LOC100577161 [Apis mellifera]